MRGIIFTGEQTFEIVGDLELRPPTANEVVVRMVNAGVCHSDLSVIDGTIDYLSPSVLGHEGAGVVEEVGREVTSVRAGDHVVVSTISACGRCPACAEGRPTRCGASIGAIDQPFTWRGAPVYDFAASSCFAEHIVIDEHQAVVIDPAVPLSSACLIGCGVMTGMGAVLHRARVTPGETAAVIGLGGVGLSAVQALRLSGATRIVAIDTNPTKRELALRCGATDFIDASDAVDVPAAVRELLPPGPGFRPGGVEWAFECTGVPSVLAAAVAALDWGGTAVAVGVPPAEATVTLPIMPLLYVDRGLLGCRAGSPRPHRDVPSIIDLYQQGRLLLDELVTEIRPHHEFGAIVDGVRDGRLARGVLAF